MLDFITYHTPIFYLIQSIWRDEAFSYFMAKPNLPQIIINTANDFNPPLYYLFLHFWMKIVDRQDLWLRFLSVLPYIITIFFAYQLAARIFSKKFAFFVAVFTMFNPMLIYYAFEMRMYSFYVLFTISSLYFFYIKNWKWYSLTGILGLYTHSFFSLTVASYVIYLWFTNKLNRRTLFQTLLPIIFFLPWLPILIVQFFHSSNSWLFPVDLQLIGSVLGNLFTSYEGTPGDWWNKTFILSVFIVLFFLIALKRKRGQALLFIMPIFLPLFLILGYSMLRRPIYVNRYMIFVTVFEIMGISLGIWCIKNRSIRNLSALLWLLSVFFINIIISPYHKKTDFKTTFAEINKIARPSDFIYAKTPICFLESAYYYKYDNRVFIYNPNNITIPNYIGVNVVFPDVSKTSFPPMPSRIFLVDDDANYEMIVRR
ncbi:hypothetical protein FJY90_04065 [Candidatus Gottesmanbacteria bacterium]|nr:hypothetical protein [Candidatus Gottesmanbacteria bacterium]